MPEDASLGRPRRAEVDARIHAAALDLVRRSGPRAATIEAVASHSGVAKTTIYRRYADREELLRGALRAAVGAPSLPQVRDVRDKTRAALEQVWTQMEQVLGRGGLAAILLDDDPAFTGLFRDALAPYDEALERLIAEDVAAGVLRVDLDADAVVTLFVGAYLGQLVRYGEVEVDWLPRALDLVWVAIAPPATA